MKILLVEDVRVERTILGHWLGELDCEVIEASNGNEGLDLYYEHRPDLVITDIIMPEKDGVQMLIELQREFPGTKMFAISGAGDTEPGEYLPLVQTIGVLRTFVKPIDKGELLEAVMEYFPETNPK
jgi:YesN/AraC family two-component response regulator